MLADQKARYVLADRAYDAGYFRQAIADIEAEPIIPPHPTRKCPAEAAGNLSRLLSLIEDNLIAADDPTLQERLDTLRGQRDEADTQVRLLAETTSQDVGGVTPARQVRAAHGHSAVGDPYRPSPCARLTCACSSIRSSSGNRNSASPALPPHSERQPARAYYPRRLRCLVLFGIGALWGDSNSRYRCEGE